MEAHVEMTGAPEDVQVAAKPQRRSFTAEYKRRLLKEADACTTPGAVGALLRRGGGYSPPLGGRGPARGGRRPARPAPEKTGPQPPPGPPRGRENAPPAPPPPP